VQCPATPSLYISIYHAQHCPHTKAHMQSYPPGSTLVNTSTPLPHLDCPQGGLHHLRLAGEGVLRVTISSVQYKYCPAPVCQRCQLRLGLHLRQAKPRITWGIAGARGMVWNDTSISV
jgi:hypothetical protein